jgi:hypothetical protein
VDRAPGHGGRPRVEAVVLAARTIDGRHLVDDRLPSDDDPAGNRFSASLDAEAYRHAAVDQPH